VSVHFKTFHPALKHAGYSATTLLPGEDRAAFEKLHRELIAELAPVGALEEDIVADVARLTWRKRNLATCRIAERAKERREQICYFTDDDPETDEQAREELGDIHELIDIGETATLGMIGRCVKQLLMVSGVKSLSSAAVSESTPQIARTRKARADYAQPPANRANTETSANLARGSSRECTTISVAGRSIPAVVPVVAWLWASLTGRGPYRCWRYPALGVSKTLAGPNATPCGHWRASNAS
jgi:hypothetical protein